MIERPVASGVLLTARTGRVLLCRRRDNGWWGVPAGMVERGESARQAMRRELFEETGYRGALCLLELRAMSDGFWLYRADVEDEFWPELNHEHVEAVWTDDFLAFSPIYPNVRDALADFALRRAQV